MDASNPLSELRDIHIPNHDVSAFPLAIGWYLLLIAIILIVIGLISIKLWYQYKKHKYLRIAQMVDKIALQQLSDEETVIATSDIIKRVALQRYTKDAPQYKNGSELLEFLNHKSRTQIFNHPELLPLQNIYQKNIINNREIFFSLIKDWLRKVA